MNWPIYISILTFVITPAYGEQQLQILCEGEGAWSIAASANHGHIVSAPFGVICRTAGTFSLVLDTSTERSAICGEGGWGQRAFDGECADLRARAPNVKNWQSDCLTGEDRWHPSYFEKAPSFLCPGSGIWALAPAINDVVITRRTVVACSAPGSISLVPEMEPIHGSWNFVKDGSDNNMLTMLTSVYLAALGTPPSTGHGYEIGCQAQTVGEIIKNNDREMLEIYATNSKTPILFAHFAQVFLQSIIENERKNLIGKIAGIFREKNFNLY